MMPSIRRPLPFTTAHPPTLRTEGWRPRRIWSFGSSEEPTLSELMGDPIFGRLLASDGVQQEHVETLISEMRYKLGYA